MPSQANYICKANTPLLYYSDKVSKNRGYFGESGNGTGCVCVLAWNYIDVNDMIEV